MSQSRRISPNGGIRVAVVGYGLAGSVFHAPLIATTNGMSVAGVVTSNQDRKSAAQNRYPNAIVFDTVDELVKQSNQFDLLVVASPNKTHAGIALQAMEAGLDVVVDKPMAINIEECEQLVRASERTGRILSVFQNRRWDNDFLTVRKLINSGELGDVFRIESRFERWRPSLRPGHWREQGEVEEGAGILFDLGSHLIDQALTIYGAPRSIYAEADMRRAGSKADDDTFIALEFQNGVRYHITLSVFAKQAAPRFQLRGNKGGYQKFGLDPQEDALRAGKLPTDDAWGEESESLWGTLSTESGGTLRDEKIRTERGDYPAFYSALAESIEQRSNPPVSAGEALLTMRVIDAARKSAKERRVVLFDDDMAIAKS